MQSVNASEKIRPVSSEPDVVGLSTAMLHAIPGDKKHQEAYKVLAYLANETLRADGGVFPSIPTKNIYLDLDGNPKREPSSWMNQVWNLLTKRAYPGIESALIRRCREQGLQHYPGVDKNTGNPARYFLYAKPLPIEVDERVAPYPQKDLTSGMLIYEPDLSLKLSWVGRQLFGNGLRLDWGKRWGMAICILLLIAAVTIGTWWLWSVLVKDRSPLNGSHVAIVTIMLAAPWYFYRRMDRFGRFIDDRISLAPDWMLSWTEFGATVEIVKANVPGEPSTVKVLRYSATCPVCGAMVKLSKGDPDFPRRLVGRCDESPREHVFSFDRVTRSGAPLIRPPKMLNCR